MAWPEQGLRHFRRSEFEHPDLVDPDLLRLVDEARHRAGHTVIVIDDVRFHADMVRIYGPDESTWANSPHQIRDDGFGHALDLRMSPWNGTTRYRFAQACMELEKEGRWPRLGLEIADEHVHVDNCPVLRRPWLWAGVSR